MEEKVVEAAETKTVEDAGEKRPSWRMLLEALIAAVLAGGGVTYLLVGEIKHEPWVGFGLIALGVVVFLMRGQTIKGFEAGPSGIKVALQEMLTKVEEVREEAEAATSKAEQAKQIAAQQITPAGRGSKSLLEAPSGEAKVLAPDDGGGGDWAHPAFERAKVPDNDPEKGQWGREDVRNGRRLSATVKPIGDNYYEVVLTVSPVGSAPPITRDVRFHLHDSFPRSIRTVKPRNGKATLSLIAWGAFTVGAEVRGEPDTYLELDLADPKYGYPTRFQSR
jgi:hypothetical protein